MPTPHDQLATLADELEATMRTLRLWSEPPPPRLPFQRPFAMDAMPFEHWLQLVLVPCLREIAERRERVPARSNLAAHAVRELDGQDELLPLVLVLRRIDELSPEPPPTAPSLSPLARRPGLAVALVTLLGAWGFVAVALAGRIAAVVPPFTSPRAFQTFVGATSPGPDYQPLHVTVDAFVDGDGAVRPAGASLLLLRSLRTMTRGPTAPLEFPLSERPTEAAVLAWLADFGVDRSADAAHAAAREALALVDAAARARTADALRAAAAKVDARARTEEIVRVGPRTPAWVEYVLVVALALAGGVPIAWALVRASRR